MKRLIWVLFVLPGCGGESKPEPETSLQSFASPEEMVSGWYHRHEIETWVAKGADEAVIDAVLERIASAPGERADERYIDSIAEYGPGNWVYEWVQVGDAAMKRWEASGLAQELEAALAYYTTASWPHLGDEQDRAALAKARQAYLALGELLPVPVRHISFPVSDSTTRGYLHLPPGEGPFPIVIFSYGSDVTKEDGMGMFSSELLARGIAMFSVDMPGIGEAADLNLLDGSDQVMVAARNFLQTQDYADPDQVYVVGASFGGNAAARAFLTEEFAGVVSLCGPLNLPFLAPPEVIDQLPALTIDGVKARVGLKGADSKAFAEVAPGLSLKVQGLYEGKKIDTPLFVFTTNQDPVAPLADLPELLARANNVEQLVIDEVGHCPPRTVRQAVVARWISDRVRESRS